MPKVGGKHYSYSPGGMRAAKRAAASTGKDLTLGAGYGGATSRRTEYRVKTKRAKRTKGR